MASSSECPWGSRNPEVLVHPAAGTPGWCRMEAAPSHPDTRPRSPVLVAGAWPEPTEKQRHSKWGLVAVLASEVTGRGQEALLDQSSSNPEDPVELPLLGRGPLVESSCPRARRTRVHVTFPVGRAGSSSWTRPTHQSPSGTGQCHHHRPLPEMHGFLGSRRYPHQPWPERVTE